MSIRSSELLDLIMQLIDFSTNTFESLILKKKNVKVLARLGWIKDELVSSIKTRFPNATNLQREKLLAVLAGRVSCSSPSFQLEFLTYIKKLRCKFFFVSRLCLTMKKNVQINVSRDIWRIPP